MKLLLVRVLGNLGETLPTGSVNEAKYSSKLIALHSKMPIGEDMEVDVK